MKFLVLAAIVAVAAAGTLQPKSVAILRMASDMHDDGSFNYNFDNVDGINVNAVVSQKEVDPKPENVGTVSRGSYSYTSPDGVVITVNWVAGGFQPQVDHFPTPPPMPEEIAHMLPTLPKLVLSQAYSYTSPEGVVITVNRVADENGFQATGDHLPTPPPMPEHVVKLLADLRAAGVL